MRAKGVKIGKKICRMNCLAYELKKYGGCDLHSQPETYFGKLDGEEAMKSIKCDLKYIYLSLKTAVGS
jgi:hypothetical protein